VFPLADASQFAPVNSQAAMAASAARRLSTGMPGSQVSMSPTQGGAIPLPAWNDPGGNPSLGNSTQAPAGPKVDPNNPLSGGTGDPNLDAYLGGDSTYQSQLSDLMRNQDQFNAQRNLTSSQTQADYDAKMRAMNDQTTQDQLNMRNTAAARGILQSGIYANQLGQYNTANQQQITNLLGGLQNTKDNAQLAYNNFVSNELAAKQNAIQQAAARRASVLGQF
jgi:hypothetical protein